MSDDPILQNAINRRDAALAEARRWDAWIAGYEELRGGLPPGSHVARPGVGRVSSGKMKPTETAAVAIIRELGRPVPSSEMMALLLERGVVIGGKEPMSTLAARLSRAESITNIRGSGWTLRDGIGTAGAPSPEEPAVSDVQPDSSPVEPAAGGGG